MTIAGYREIRQRIEEAAPGKPWLPENIRSDALAKCAYEDISEGKSMRDLSYTLLYAKVDLLEWIRETFEGGSIWVANHDFWDWSEDSAERRLHAELDQKGKFGWASRYFHAFVVRGEPKLAVKRRFIADGGWRQEYFSTLIEEQSKSGLEEEPMS